MLTLRPVKEAELASFLEYEIETSARQTAVAYEMPLDQVRKEVRQQLTALLPEGVETPDHFLRFVNYDDDSGKVPIGRLWFSIEEPGQFAWLDTIEIDEAYRGQGFGRQLLALTEAELSQHGIHSMSLHVAGTNEHAFKFYQKCGYHTAAYNMLKKWTPHRVEPDLALCPVTVAQVESIVQHEIETLTQALEAVYALDRQQANHMASTQVTGRLPDGLQTAGHFLYLIDKEDSRDITPVGHVWFSISQKSQTAWLQSFALTGNVQSQEMASQALTRLEAELSKQGIDYLKLYLVGNDLQTLEMYRRHGFQIGGYHMTKRW